MKITLALSLVILIVGVAPCCWASETMTLRTGANNDERIVFKFPDCDATIKFQHDITLTKMRWSSDKITFYSCTMDAGPSSTFGLGVTNTSVTVTQLFKDNYFIAQLSPIANTSQLTLTSKVDEPTVWGSALGMYSYVGSTLTVDMTGTDVTMLYLHWLSGGPIGITYTLTVTVQHINGSVLKQTEVTLIDAYGNHKNKLSSEVGEAVFTVVSGTYLVQVTYDEQLYTEAITIEDDDAEFTLSVGEVIDLQEPSWVRPAIIVIVCIVIGGLYLLIRKLR